MEKLISKLDKQEDIINALSRRLNKLAGRLSIMEDNYVTNEEMTKKYNKNRSRYSDLKSEILSLNTPAVAIKSPPRKEEDEDILIEVNLDNLSIPSSPSLVEKNNTKEQDDDLINRGIISHFVSN